MKLAFTILIALSCQSLASPAEVNKSLRDDGLYSGEEDVLDMDEIESISIMDFVGPLTPGGPNVTLSGTAKEIYEQILELNPSYSVWDFDEYADDLEARGLTREDIDVNNPSLKIRSSVMAELHGRDNELFNCNIGSYVGNVWSQCGEGFGYLWNLGKAWCGAKAKSCARVSCSHNCGMYLCSKLSKEKKVHCGNIANDMVKIAYECGSDVTTWAYRARGQMQFSCHNTKLSSPSC
ncbi:unnamed protein product [Clonostachys rosea f. rosea IK726]|uniref:Uncharacterized protein n=1 Tax=Clonostachys rosea f. rosea IK726 TaxID=1349383 RepID=A0ACA9U3K5_BIOOC|nr:unnamed protein product [Clonostachys rosea f. rosea IK726]